ncbi:MAG TPA: UDP-N-acetylglucosamine 2-epimerase [Acidobacteriota bacterium]|nr:UDP-N-acetylglucosamine 2-epimerase [Acidobacteriota bacterium]
MRKIGIVTTSRADFGLYRPIIREIEKKRSLDYFLIVTGSHMSKKYGFTLTDIENEGFRIAERGRIFSYSDTAESTAKSMAKSIGFYAGAFVRQKPDLLMVLGDRFEMFCASLAALPFNIPVAHIHGGEVTEGAMDDSLRHAMTKLSHIHFTATEEYRQRVIQLGEDPEMVITSGAPSLDNLKNEKLLAASEIKTATGFDPSEPFILATLHPETVGGVSNSEMALAFFAALEDSGKKVLVTMPNADPGANEIREIIKKITTGNRRFFIFENLGTRLYFSMMKHASAMAGNSSSGIIEAASFGLPVVNVGDRQKGRVRGKNIVDVPPDKKAISVALKKVAHKDFRKSLIGMKNPYGDGESASVIVSALSRPGIDRSLCRKRFHDLGPERKCK